MEYLDVFTKIERIERTRDLEVDELMACASDGVFVEDEHGQVYPVLAVAIDPTRTEVFVVLRFLGISGSDAAAQPDRLFSEYCDAYGLVLRGADWAGAGFGEFSMSELVAADYDIATRTEDITAFLDTYDLPGLTRVDLPALEQILNLTQMRRVK